jgi:hypothetical protein
MANRHDLSLLFETGLKIFAGIVQKESLPNDRIDPWRLNDRGVHVLTLTWQSMDGVKRVLVLEAVDGLDEVVANISIWAFQDSGKSWIGRGFQNVPKFRQELDGVRHVDKKNEQQLYRELESALGKAFASIARYQPPFDPGEIKTGSVLTWKSDLEGKEDKMIR